MLLFETNKPDNIHNIYMMMTLLPLLLLLMMMMMTGHYNVNESLLRSNASSSTASFKSKSARQFPPAPSKVRDHQILKNLSLGAF